MTVKEKARNLKLFYWNMRGYPGINLAKELINHFCHYHKFTFGKCKGKCIGEIIMTDLQYIMWCINNIPLFEMNEEEKALCNTSWEYNIGGYTSELNYGYTYIKDGDTYDRDFINREIELMERDEQL